MNGKIIKTGLVTHEEGKMFLENLNNILIKEFSEYKNVDIQYQIAIAPSGKLVQSALVIVREE